MERVLAIDDTGPAGRGSCELDGCLDRFRTRIGKKCLLKIRHAREQTFGENAGHRRYIHLHEIGELVIEDTLERRAQSRVVAPNPEHAKSAHEIKIASLVAIVEILALAATKADIISDGAEDFDHLRIEVASVQRV